MTVKHGGRQVQTTSIPASGLVSMWVVVALHLKDYGSMSQDSSTSTAPHANPVFQFWRLLKALSGLTKAVKQFVVSKTHLFFQMRMFDVVKLSYENQSLSSKNLVLQQDLQKAQQKLLHLQRFQRRLHDQLSQISQQPQDVLLSLQALQSRISREQYAQSRPELLSTTSSTLSAGSGLNDVLDDCDDARTYLTHMTQQTSVTNVTHSYLSLREQYNQNRSERHKIQQHSYEGYSSREANSDRKRARAGTSTQSNLSHISLGPCQLHEKSPLTPKSAMSISQLPYDANSSARTERVRSKSISRNRTGSRRANPRKQAVKEEEDLSRLLWALGPKSPSK